MNNMTANFVRAILQGMTGAGLFRRLRYPGGADTLLGDESLAETFNNPFYTELAKAFVARRERKVQERQVADYYSRLYNEPQEHAHDHTSYEAC